jgi:hypothetical protein
MSASTATTRSRPGESVYREAAARRAAMVAERQDQVEQGVHRRLAEFGSSASADQRQTLEAQARFDAFADLAPVSVREQTQALFDEGTAPAELLSQVERVVETGGDRYEQSEVLRLGLEEVAEKIDGAAEGMQERPGRMQTVIQFHTGKRMKAEAATAAPGSPIEIIWHTAESDIAGCQEQHAMVRDAAARSGMEMVDEDLETRAGERPREREAGGEAG